MFDIILAQAIKCSDFQVPLRERPVFEQRHWMAVKKNASSDGSERKYLYWRKEAEAI